MRPVTDPLARLAAVAFELGLHDVAADAETFAVRVAEGRFFVACIGQFKRGKSTLLNALLGDPVLPTGVVPVTAVVTVIRHGTERGARVRGIGGDWQDIGLDDLRSYVVEAENPGNAKQVAAVEVFLPHRLLAPGMCLVDTPGLGSVFKAASAATHAFMPHVDAALVVLGADPPVSGDELDLVEETARQVDDLVFVMNKADRLPAAERAEAHAFTERVLSERLGRPIGRLLEVSAAEQLAAPEPTRDWAELCRRLDGLASRSGGPLVRAAEARGIHVVAGRVLHELAERRDALRRPLAESAVRIESLRRCVGEAERSLDDLHHQLAGEQERLAAALRGHLQRFLDRALPEARAALSGALESCRSLPREALNAEAARFAQDIARRMLERWRLEEAPEAEASYRAASRRFVEAANSLLAHVTVSGALDPAHTPRVLGDETGFRVPGDFRYTELLALTSPSPLAWIPALFHTRRQAARRLARRADAYLARLLFTNANRVANGLIEQAAVSRGRLESDLRRQLLGVVASAERALDEARALEARGGEAVRVEVERLEGLRAEVAAMRPREQT